MFEKVILNVAIIFYITTVTLTGMYNQVVWYKSWFYLVSIVQLLSAAIIILICLKKVWLDRQVISGVLTSLIVPTGFLISYSLRLIYSDTAMKSYSAENGLIGFDIEMSGISLVLVLFGISIMLIIKQLLSFNLESVNVPSSWLEGIM